MKIKYTKKLRLWALPGAEMLSQKIDARKQIYQSFAKFISFEKYGLYGTLNNTGPYVTKAPVIGCTQTALHVT